jgi:hypothetical protein
VSRQPASASWSSTSGNQVIDRSVSSRFDLRLEFRLSLVKRHASATLKHLSEGRPDLRLDWFWATLVFWRWLTVALRPKSESEAMRPEARAISSYPDQPIPEKVNVEKIETPFQPAAPGAKLFEQHSVVRNSLLLPPSLASLFEVRFANQCSNMVRALTKSKAENSLAIERPHWCMRASAQREDQSGGTNQLPHVQGRIA